MDMQSRDRYTADDASRRADELERERIEALERSEPLDRSDAPMESDPDMTGVPVEPAEPGGDSRLGGAVVGGALGAVAGAIVGGPAGAIVGGAVGAAGGAVVGSTGKPDDMVYDIDRQDIADDIRRPRDEDLENRM